MTSPRIRGILFDLDDTLIRYTDAERSALAAGCRLAAKRHPHIRERSLAAAIFQIYAEEFAYDTPGYSELATLSVEEFRIRITGEALRLFGVVDPELTATLVATYRDAERAALRTFPEVSETLELLRPAFRLGVITNGPSATQREKIATVALTDWFSEIIVDTEFGCPKPDARIFEHAAERIGLPASELIFVGNSLEADIEGARQAGWISVWLNTERAPVPASAPQPDFVVGSLAELPFLAPIARVLGEIDTTQARAGRKF